MPRMGRKINVETVLTRRTLRPFAGPQGVRWPPPDGSSASFQPLRRLHKSGIVDQDRARLQGAEPGRTAQMVRDAQEALNPSAFGKRDRGLVVAADLITRGQIAYPMHQRHPLEAPDSDTRSARHIAKSGFWVGSSGANRRGPDMNRGMMAPADAFDAAPPKLDATEPVRSPFGALAAPSHAAFLPRTPLT
jgi:hypothetical protein